MDSASAASVGSALEALPALGVLQPGGTACIHMLLNSLDPLALRPPEAQVR